MKPTFRFRIHPRRALTAAALALAACLLVVALVFGSAGYRLPAWAASSGGGALSSGPYRLTGTTGQPDAAPNPLAAGPYTLYGGFWAAASARPPSVYLPLLSR